ncbi:MAG: hypothetical protein R3E86_11170 [Pseudomonadales bacterium]
MPAPDQALHPGRGRAAPWTVGFARRTHPLLLPLLWAVPTFTYFAIVIVHAPAGSQLFRASDQAWGSALIYSLLPAYLLGCSYPMWLRASQSAAALRPVLADPERVVRMISAGPVLLRVAGALFGMGFGVLQLAGALERIAGSPAVLLDASVFCGNVAVWTTVGFVVAEGLRVSVAFSRAGSNVRVDLYDFRTLRPFARVASLYVLVVMGALALMPVQAVSTDIRVENYLPGLIVGVPAGVFMFVLPLWGVHRAIAAARGERLDELRERIARVDRSDLAQLELLLGHLDRMRALHTWPVDVRMLSRALFYLVLPPLAWVAAALVEVLVDRLLA